MDQEYAHAQSKYSASNAGAGSIFGDTAAKQIRTPSEFETILKRLDGLNVLARSIRDTAEGVADRLLGPVPENEGTGIETPYPNGQIAQIHESMSSVSRVLEQASASLDRLNRL